MVYSPKGAAVAIPLLIAKILNSQVRCILTVVWCSLGRYGGLKLGFCYSVSWE